MPSRERLRATGLLQFDATRRAIGVEARSLRIRAGISQSELAATIRVSRGWLHRLETGGLRTLDLGRTSVLYAHLGHRLSVKAFPAGAPLRDAGHTRLLERFTARIPADWRRAFEAPMPSTGDLRAWDLLLIGPIRIGVEAETRLRDIQAVERSVATKRRDSRIDRTILLVADTVANRAVVRGHLATLRVSHPLTTREVMSALRLGRDPGGDGLVIL